MDKYRIVLADDHPLLRQGLKKIIHENGVMKVIGEAGDGMALLKLLIRLCKIACLTMALIFTM